MAITPEYVEKLPPIYRDILAAFPAMEPTRKAGYGLAYQTLYERLRPHGHSLGEIILACKQMAEGGAVQIKNNIFVHPTPMGEEIIAALTGKEAAAPLTVPEFPVPPN